MLLLASLHDVLFLKALERERFTLVGGQLNLQHNNSIFSDKHTVVFIHLGMERNDN